MTSNKKFRAYKGKTEAKKPEFDPKTVPNYAEMVALAESGDINVPEFMAAYHAKYGKDFPLGKEWLLAICAFTDEPYPYDMYAAAMHYVTEGTPIEDAVAKAIAELPEDWKENIEEPEDASGEEEEGEETEVKAGKETASKKVSAVKETEAQKATKRQRSISVHIAALKAAEAFANDDELNEMLEEVSVAPEVTKRGPARTLLGLLRKTATFSPNGYDVMETPIDAWPEVGSTIKSIDPAKSNAIFDKYDYNDEKGTRIKGSFYEDIMSKFPKGKAILDELDLVKQALDKERPNPTKYPSNSWSKSRLEAMKNLYDGRRKGFLNCLRDAVALRHKWVEIESKMPNINIGWNYMLDKDGKVLKENGIPVLDPSTENIVVSNKGAYISGSETFKVKDVLRWNVDKAVEGGGHLGALKDSVETTPNPKSKGKEKNEITVPELSTFSLFLQSIHALADFGNRHRLPSDRKSLNASVAKIKSGEGYDDYVESIGDAWEIIDALYTARDRQRYTELNEAKSKEAEERRLAKQQANG